MSYIIANPEDRFSREEAHIDGGNDSLLNAHMPESEHKKKVGGGGDAGGRALRSNVRRNRVTR